MEKQIEEIKDCIDSVYGCDCAYFGVDGLAIADAIYKADYRKQSDTAREIFAEIGKILTAKYNAIQAGYHHRMRYGNVDTPQGMKELGELAGVREIIDEIKTFEKRYMEGTEHGKAD